MPSIVYILTNPSMPGLIVIGETDNLKQSMEALHKTNVPEPFQCLYAGELKDAEFIEKCLHRLFAHHRVSAKRKFFKIDPKKVLQTLQLAKPKDVTPKKDEPAPNARVGRRANFCFAMVNIPVGETLTFCSNETITCKVFDNKKVEFRGKIRSLTAAAKKVLPGTAQVGGPRYWCYENESLHDIRKRMENDS